MKFVDEQGEGASPTLSALRAYREHRAAGAVLGVIGIYGVASAAARRRRDIGIRLALGATRTDVCTRFRPPRAGVRGLGWQRSAW